MLQVGRRKASCAALAVVLAAGLSAVPAAPAAVSGGPQAHASNAVVGAIGEALAKSGVAFIVAKLKTANTGNERADAAIGFVVKLLEDPVLSQLQEVKAELTAVKAELVAVNNKLDDVRQAILQGHYNTLLGQVADTISGINHAEKLLDEVVRATDRTQRVNLGKELDRYIASNLMDKQSALALRITPDAPGGEGLIKSASKASAAAANPFYTPALSRIPEEAFRYFTLYEGLLLQLRVEHMHAHPETYSKEHVAREIATWSDEFGRQNTLRAMPVHPYTFVDTRTKTLWGWVAKDRAYVTKPWYTETSPGTPFKMTYALALAADLRFTPDLSRYSAGRSWSEQWRIPSLQDMRTLMKDSTGSPVSWLHNRTGGVFPSSWSPGGTPWVWTTTVPAAGVQEGYNMDHGSVTRLNRGHEFGVVAMEPRPSYNGVPYPTDGFPTNWWYW